MSTTPKPASKPVETYPPVHLDNTKAAVGVWLVKVPKYLAKKWNEAPDNAEVGRIRITQSNMGREVAFHLNEQLGQTVTIKVGDKSFDEKIPLEHKFITTPLGSQDVFVLKQQEEGAKEVLQTIGKVMQRAECVPITTDTRYLKLKRETMKNHIEPKRQIKMADGFVQRHHYLPKSTHTQNNDKKDKTKRLRKDKDKVLDILFHAFTKHQYYNIKNLEKITQQPTSYLKDILHQICKYNGKGLHKNTWELKEEYKQGSMTESKKTAVIANINEKKKTEKKEDDYMDDDEEDLDDSDDDDDDDDDDMIEQM